MRTRGGVYDGLTAPLQEKSCEQKERRESQCEGKWVSRGGRKRVGRKKVLTGVNLHIQTVKDPSTATRSSILSLTNF